MASVHFGRLNGPVGFRRTVAIKRMLQAFAGSPQARAMLIDEARVAARISHANVVQTLDVVEEGDELFLVLEYVHGQSLERLLARAKELGQRPPVRVVTAVLVGALRGLHAAHDARGEDGKPLELVHRDLSPHNVIVDVNGVSRVLDFGIARARGRLQSTGDGQLKGKLAYLAPEQVHGDSSRRSDLFAAGVVLWEALAGRQLFQGETEAALLSQVLRCQVPKLSAKGVDAPALQKVLERALEREPEARFATAAEFADALEACGVASQGEVAAWVNALVGEGLAARAKEVDALDSLEVEAAAPSPKARSRWPVVVAIASAGVVAAALWWTLRGPVEGVQALSPTLSPAGERETVVAVPAPAPAPVPVPVADPVSVPVVKPKPPRPVATPPVVKPATKAGCDPPWLIDADGVKRFKVECLEGG
jgi:serine/threonine-protein kinase